MSSSESITSSATTEVAVRQGYLSGEQLGTVTRDGYYYSFKGIPYAQPPVGTFRFKAPRPPLPWKGIRKATMHGPKCPQMDIYTQRYIKGDEDCLYLNVYTPQLKPKVPLAVMVFIHGGGYKCGSGDTDQYRPDFLVSRGVILVTINYRLDALGFLCLNTKEVPGNAGLKDQVAALRWVKENIANFGGDPMNITVFGQSSGGASTALHLLSPMSKGLFCRAISMSGVPFCDWSLPFLPHKRAYVLGKQLGLETDNPNLLLEFLQKVPVELLINTSPNVLSSEEYNIIKMYHFTPVVEKNFGIEHFLTSDPLEILQNGDINDVDVLIGYTDLKSSKCNTVFEESLLSNYDRYPDLLVPRKIQLKCAPNEVIKLAKRIHDYYFKGKSICLSTTKEFLTYTNDICLVYDIDRFMSELSKIGYGRRFMYILSYVSDENMYENVNSNYGIREIAHLDDLMCLVDTKVLNLEVLKNTKEYELIKVICTLFTNFAKYGNPTPDCSLGVMWRKFGKERAYVSIGETLTAGTNPNAETIEFWRCIYQSAGLIY